MRRAIGRASSGESTIGFGPVVLANMLALVDQFAGVDVPCPDHRLRYLVGGDFRVEPHKYLPGKENYYKNNRMRPEDQALCEGAFDIAAYAPRQLSLL